MMQYKQFSFARYAQMVSTSIVALALGVGMLAAQESIEDALQQGVPSVSFGRFCGASGDDVVSAAAGSDIPRAILECRRWLPYANDEISAPYPELFAFQNGSLAIDFGESFEVSWYKRLTDTGSATIPLEELNRLSSIPSALHSLYSGAPSRRVFIKNGEADAFSFFLETNNIKGTELFKYIVERWQDEGSVKTFNSNSIIVHSAIMDVTIAHHKESLSPDEQRLFDGAATALSLWVNEGVRERGQTSFDEEKEMRFVTSFLQKATQMCLLKKFAESDRQQRSMLNAIKTTFLEMAQGTGTASVLSLVGFMEQNVDGLKGSQEVSMSTSDLDVNAGEVKINRLEAMYEFFLGQLEELYTYFYGQHMK